MAFEVDGTNGTIKMMKLGLVALKSNFVQLDRPYKLTFAITYRCQSRCLTCNIWQMKPTNELSIDEIRKFASQNRFSWIEITGGEPFLRSDIVDIVRAFFESSKDLYIVTIPTNSLSDHSMITGKVEEMLKMGLPRLSITVSLDGYRELHDQIRGIKGNYDRAIDLFKKLKALQSKYKNLVVVFGYTVSRYNQGSLEKTFQEVKHDIPDITYNDFHINVGQLSDIYYGNTNLDIVAKREIISDEIKRFVSKRKFQIGAIPIIEGIFLKKLIEYLQTGRSPMRSRSLDASLFLDSYGNVYPSIMWGRKIGNIRESNYSLDGIWHSNEAEEVRKLIMEGKEPQGWTACEAYQTIVGDIKDIF